MTRVGQYLAVVWLASHAAGNGESPAYLIRVMQRAAVLASQAGLANDASYLIAQVQELAHLRDLRARQAWRSARRSLPFWSRLIAPRRPSRGYIDSHTAHDVRRAELDIENLLEELED